MRFEQVQRFILAKKIFWGEGHFKVSTKKYIQDHITKQDIKTDGHYKHAIMINNIITN